MRNYKYKLIDQEIIVTEQEHQAILKKMQEGQNIIVLRKGELVINTNMLGYAKKTDKLTSLQEKENHKRLAVPPNEREGIKELIGISKQASGLDRIINQTDKMCAGCKKIHYIMGESKYCLGCRRRTIKELL